MIANPESPRIDIDPNDMARSFNREPFGFAHDLHRLDIFSIEALRVLAGDAAAKSYFVAGGAPTAGTTFYDVEHGRLTPREAVDRLFEGNHRVIINRPETFDARFRSLFETTFAQILALRTDLHRDRIARVESAVLISSPNTITPFHFDPESTFFFHIEGEKIYHLYAPDCVSEPELERFYKMGIVNIGQLDLAARAGAREYRFELAPGRGMHQPHDAPHWVETGAGRSISYAIAFETIDMQARNMTRAFNHYQRKSRLIPARVGEHPRSDALKARVMELALPARRSARQAIRTVFGR